MPYLKGFHLNGKSGILFTMINAGNFKTTEEKDIALRQLLRKWEPQEMIRLQDQTFIDFSLHMNLFCRNLWLKQSNNKMRLLLFRPWGFLRFQPRVPKNSFSFPSLRQSAEQLVVARCLSLLPSVPWDPHQMTPHFKKPSFVCVFCGFLFLHINKDLPQKNEITQILVESIKTLRKAKLTFYFA